jgi:hypothetical protein
MKKWDGSFLKRGMVLFLKRGPQAPSPAMNTAREDLVLFFWLEASS